jgi:hypothetical protein
MKMPTISFAHAIIIRQAATMSDPTTINGLRLPYFDFDLSAITPTIGCMMSPDRGPAIHTRDVRLFVRPSARRYGVQSIKLYQQRLQLLSRYASLTGHLNSPSEPVPLISLRCCPTKTVRLLL